MKQTSPEGANRLDQRGMKPCAFPGCGSVIAEQCKSGLCNKHRHAHGLCTCAQCSRTGIGAVRLPPSPGARAAAAQDKVCAVPDCRAHLAAASVSLVCKTHLHEAPYCRCLICTGETAAKPKQLPAHLKRVTVSHPTSNSGVPSHVQITMLKMPWELNP